MTTKPVAPGANGMNALHRVPTGLALGLVLAHALGGGCGGDDDGDTASRGRWCFEELDAALMSVAGTSSSDVWTVGADMPRRQRRAGAALRRRELDARSHRYRRDRPLVGARPVRGLGVHGRREAERCCTTTASGVRAHGDAPELETVFGIWGAADGRPLGRRRRARRNAPGFVWRYDGSAWTDVHRDLLPSCSAHGRPALFKVWGPRADDVWIVGAGRRRCCTGTARRSQRSIRTPTRRLFTVHGPRTTTPRFVAVGGFGDAVIVENAGTDWHNITPDPAPPELFGVFVVSADEAYAVGVEGLVMDASRGRHGSCSTTGVELFNPFHSVWVDPEGGVWAVGWRRAVPVPRQGMLLHRGKAISDEIRGLRTARPAAASARAGRWARCTAASTDDAETGLPPTSPA